DARPAVPAIPRSPGPRPVGDAAQRQSTAYSRRPVAARVGSRRAAARRTAAVPVRTAPPPRHRLCPALRVRRRPSRSARGQSRARSPGARIVKSKELPAGTTRAGRRRRIVPSRLVSLAAIACSVLLGACALFGPSQRRALPWAGAEQLVLVVTP